MSYSNAGRRLYTVAPDPKRCGECQMEGNQGRGQKQLKQCSGCEYVVYCSKECQRAAWPAHKKICRSNGGIGVATPRGLHVPPTDQPLPLPSRLSEIPSCISAGNDLQQFLDAQAYTLCYQLTALVYMYYGRTDNLNDAPLVFRCLIAPVKRQSLTPANSWFIRTFWVSSLKTECEINPNFVQVWEEQQHTFSMSEKRGKEMLGPSDGGLVTVIFHVEDSDFKVLSHIPFMALRQPQALGNPRIRSAVEDAGQLCGLYTNHGIPIWPLFDTLFRDPTPIGLVRKGRWWRRVALQDFYGAEAIGRRLHSWQTKYLPFQLIAILHGLSVEQDVMLTLQQVTRKMVNDIAVVTGRRLVVPWS